MRGTKLWPRVSLDEQRRNKSSAGALLVGTENCVPPMRTAVKNENVLVWENPCIIWIGIVEEKHFLTRCNIIIAAAVTSAKSPFF